MQSLEQSPQGETSAGALRSVKLWSVSSEGIQPAAAALPAAARIAITAAATRPVIGALPWLPLASARYNRQIHFARQAPQGHRRRQSLPAHEKAPQELRGQGIR